MREPINYAKYRIRTCYYMHECAVCEEDIRAGQRYHDGGYSRRAHLDCAVRHEAVLLADGHHIERGSHD